MQEIPQPDYKIKLGDILSLPFVGYARYRIRHNVAVTVGQRDASLRSTGLFLFHTLYASSIGFGLYLGVSSALEKIVNS